MLQAEGLLLAHGSLVLPPQQQGHLQLSFLLGSAELPISPKLHGESQRLYWVYRLVSVSVQPRELLLQKP